MDLDVYIYFFFEVDFWMEQLHSRCMSMWRIGGGCYLSFYYGLLIWIRVCWVPRRVNRLNSTRCCAFTHFLGMIRTNYKQIAHLFIQWLGINYGFGGNWVAQTTTLQLRMRVLSPQKRNWERKTKIRFNGAITPVRSLHHIVYIRFVTGYVGNFANNYRCRQLTAESTRTMAAFRGRCHGQKPIPTGLFINPAINIFPRHKSDTSSP